MAKYDREELLERTDLVELFGELVGPVRKEGAGWKAPCPSPGHAQTGSTPPVSIDAAGRLWNCFACDARGSAIDLVALVQGVEVATAFDWLAARAKVRPVDEHRPRHRPAPPARKPVPTEAQKDGAGLESYVDECAAALWQPAGGEVLAWLRARGLSDEVLQANRVGADLGTAPRSEGLPSVRGGHGAVFPVLDAASRSIYVQLRRIDPAAKGKYLNPAEAQWGPSPRVAVLRGGVDGPGAAVMVCEGMPDALTAIDAGYRAVALLGTKAPDESVAARLVEQFPDEHLVLALDGDAAGVAAADRLAELLAGAGAGRRVWRIQIPEWVSTEPKGRDLNAWATVAGDVFAEQLVAAVTAAEPAGWRPVLNATALMPALLADLNNPSGALAVTTGIRSLDALLANGGWRPGLFLLGGLPGIGKSAFAVQAALRAGAALHPTVYVSVEQSEQELLGRIFCHELEAPIAAYWNREPGFAAGVRQHADQLPLDQLYLRTDPYIAGEDHLGTVGRVRRWVEEVADTTGLRPLVVVDYLQRMRPPEADRRLDERLRISMAGLGLRQLARDLEVPVLVVSSIGRGSYEGMPKLDWFKGSGDLEYDADACIILRPDAGAIDNDKAVRMRVELHLVKNRYGKLTGDHHVGLTFDRRFGSFVEDQFSPAARAAGAPAPPPSDF